jgi:hypothetical protein
MKRLCLIPLLAAIGSAYPAVAEADGPKHRKLSAVPFTEVKVRDDFWAPRIRTNREKSLPHTFQWCEKTGRLSNFAKAGKLMEGEFEGIYFNDSDVYKVLEGAAYSLADHPDPVLEKMVDDVIAKIAAAQQENGYLNSYYTLKAPDKKWTNLRGMHELYCAGHLTEGAVAHHRATGKRTLLDVAVKFADRIDEIFGPQKRHDVPGHEELELALVKLYELTGEERYFDLAKFFLDVRGDESKRPRLYGAYCQDHLPVRKQSEIVGHAVRAMYLYSGVADVAGYTGDQELTDAMDRLWHSVVLRKMYITGGIGVQGHGEGFSGDYALPNSAAYCETCAAIGMALWNHRLNLMHGHAKYADVVERAMYNGILSGIDLGGEKFFYVNPLASGGGRHRQPFYPCACCPTNVVRFVPSVPGYVYATGKDGIFVNLYVAGTATVPLGYSTVRVTQQARYPWDGKVKLTIEPQQTARFALNLRIPDWCTGAKLPVNNVGPDDRRKRAKLTVNGAAWTKLNVGYERIEREWKDGDVIELDLPMEIERIEAHPRVKADVGRVAVRRGPIVYCFEAIDNGGRVSNIILPHDPKFTAEHRPDLLGGVTVIEGVARDGRKILGVPYYAWDHREPGEMIVWVRQDGKSRTPDMDDRAWQEKLYRPLDPATLGPSTPWSLTELSTPSASHRRNDVGALNDLIEPSDSCDHGVPRFTWWDHKGTKEWVQYDFPSAKKVSAVELYWFDDERLKRHCRTPQSWRLLCKAGDGWKPVETESEYGTALNKYNRVAFTPVETTALRIEVQLKPQFSGGILEWKVE